MEERGNKTIMCSVLFLDIVEYSRKPVAVQILLKERFNGYLAAAIHDVPVADRIILDGGERLAISFLGAVGDALKTALNLRESLLNENPSMDARLQVSMGINLGPVRLVRDDNGQPCVVGDGISVAQRVTDFADASQILVSRSYYDAVLRLLPQYAGWFHYQGSRTDKHVREHELFAVGYPEDQPGLSVTGELLAAGHAEHSQGVAGRIRSGWQNAASRLGTMVERQSTRLQHAGVSQRTVYVGMVMIPLLLLAMLTTKLFSHFMMDAEPQVVGSVPAAPASEVQPALELRVTPELTTPPASEVPAVSIAENQPVSPFASTQQLPPQSGMDKRETRAPATTKQQAAEEQADEEGFSLKAVARFINKHLPSKETAVVRSDTAATVVVNCTDGATVLVDGKKVGVISSGSMTFTLLPGKHLIGIHDMTRGSVYSRENRFEAGKTLTISPGLCL